MLSMEDKELSAIAQVLDLSPAAQARVLAYLVGRIGSSEPDPAPRRRIEAAKSRAVAARSASASPAKIDVTRLPADTVCDLSITKLPTKSFSIVQLLRAERVRGLAEARDLYLKMAANLPYRLWEGIQLEQARTLRARFEAEGAEVSIDIPSDHP